EGVERPHRQLQIRNSFGFGKLGDAHEVQRSAVAPSKLAVEPRQPTAMPDELFALGQTAADLDHVLDGLLAEVTDRLSVFGKERRGGCGAGTVICHFFSPWELSSLRRR